MRDTLTGHVGLFERIEDQLKARDAAKPVVWFHVASAGEYLQALPVMERLMDDGTQCALTITSVSGYRWANKRKDQYPNLVLLDYFPLDTQTNVNRLLDMIQPTLTVYVKFDLWPNLIWETRKRGIPQFLISATLHNKSKRVTSSLARSFYSSLYQCLDQILTVTDDDKKRFLETCPEHKNITTVGDTRFDSVLDRKAKLATPELPEFIRNKTVLVLGSIWPADEHHIFPVITKALNNFSDLFVIAAPHETDKSHIDAIEKTFKKSKPAKFTENNLDSDNRVLIVDTVGQLSALYAYANIAYVGGAFSTGVHNTMEPAAMGVPAIFGPFYQNSPEAMDMVEAKKCFSIRNETEFESLLNKLLNDVSYRKAAGESAAQYIQTQAGASDACFLKIKECIAK
ncbi:MAG: 3-deoxy-D-manno-octulosonic acid transferase [Gammaproteobacteria bacterium]|nr:3-deoxy-D-manno-octulosonic acid transferase [Gammaproteobacteria bacterium]